MKRGKNLFCNLFLAPAFLIYTGFIVTAIIMTVYYSTLKWNGLGKSSFAGLSNFLKLFQDQSFLQSARNTLVLLILAIIIQNIIGLFLAYLVSRISRGYTFFRGSYFVPVVVTSAAVATIFVLFFSDTGPLNWMLHTVGLDGLIRKWLSDPKTVLYCVIFPEIWQYTGTYFMIHLAGVQSIPSDVLESARMDGAGSIRVLTQIIVPMMSEVIQVGVLLALINALKSFNFSWIMTFGGPGSTSSYVSVYMYKKVFQDYQYGYGSSIAVSLLVVLIIVTVLFKNYFNSLTRDQH